MYIKAPKPLEFVYSDTGLVSWVRRKPPYLWRSRRGSGPSPRHDLLRNVTAPLVGVSYSYLWE